MSPLTPSIVTPDPFIQRVLDKFLRLGTDELQVHPASAYDTFPQEQVAAWCHRHAAYGLPTAELISFLIDRIGGRSAIEIGAGNGVLGKALGIPCTDNFLQNRPDIRQFYAITGQPTIAYGKHVQQMDALHAVRHFRPQVVIGQWVTQWVPMDSKATVDGNAWGIKEDKILEHVEEYIVIGHESIHGTKAIMPRVSEVIRAPWLRSRSMKPGNMIFIWKGARS